MPALESLALENGWDTPRNALEEKKSIEKLNLEAQSGIQIGDTFYAISFRWWKSWESYTSDLNHVSEDSNVESAPPILSVSPPEIDNKDLVETEKVDELSSETFLRSDAIENSDFILVPASIWAAFKKWYGGGPEIPLKVIRNGENLTEQKTVEVFPLSLIIVNESKQTSIRTRISRMATEFDLRKKICAYLDIDPKNARLWDHYDGNRRNLLAQDTPLYQLGIALDHQILVETKKSWEEFPPIFASDSNLNKSNHTVAIRTPVEKISIAGGPLASHSTAIIPIPPAPPSLPSTSVLTPALTDERNSESALFMTNGVKGLTGQTGLVNLGNTCFMNSALQCLVHTPPLNNYFMADYSREINTVNPLGLQGELAIAFGELLRKLWLPEKSSPLAPRAFKAKLSRFAPQFSGYNQHDSQELLAFLLDGLHEDLNRVKKKPYIEAKDSDDRPDKEVAEEYWENHKARNDSIIVDICQGQYKSKLVCPVCQKLSVTFDPFMYLSLPLPSKQLRSMTMTLVSSGGYKPLQVVTVNVLKDGCFKDLENLLFKEGIVNEYEDLRFVEIHDFRIFRAFRSSEPLSLLQDNDKLIIYRFKEDISHCIPAFVTLRKLERSSFTGRNSTKLFPYPLVASFPKEGPKTSNDFFEAIMATLKPFEKRIDKEEKRDEKPRENGKELGIHLKVEDSPEDESVTSDPNSLSSSEPQDFTQSSSHSSSGLPNGFSKVKEESDEGEAMSIDENVKTDILIDSDETNQPALEPYPFRIWTTSEKGDTSENEIVRGVDLPEELKRCDMVKELPHLAIDFSNEMLADYDLKPLEKIADVRSNSFFKRTPESVSLHSCLENFIKEEPLGPDDMWFCPRCKKHQQATKKLDLWKLPEILVIHLKRFSYSRIFKHKLDAFVRFPVKNLDLSDYVRGDDNASHIYDLYAVSNHYGGMGGGHYTAYAKLDDGKWYNFDDSHVSPIDEDSIVTPAAYVLFYQRNN